MEIEASLVSITNPGNGNVNWSKVDNPELALQRFPSRRSVVYGTKGVVSSSQPLATEAGLEILRQGGNAADAAVATSAALNVTEPGSCGIGGDASCLFYDAKTRTVKALNGSGRAPEKLSAAYLRARGIADSVPTRDVNSVTVPGAAAAWVDTVDVFGNGKLSLAEILQPAIRLADEGVPISEINSHSWGRSVDFLKAASSSGHDMLLDGKAPLPGQIMRFPNLAETFRAVAEHGKDGFYKGRIAEAIVEVIKSKGGVMELEDLAKHTSSFVEPIKYAYGGEVTVYEAESPTGITTLLALGILESIQEQGLVGNLLEMEHNSAEYLHTLVEVLRLAFADSQHYVADPDFEYVPVKELLDKSYLASRAALFNPKKTNPQVIHGSPVQSSDTVYFSVTDQWGNACSYIQSIYTEFGTGIVPKGCGFTLHSRGATFSLKEGHPNMLKGGKRPYNTIIPALVTRGDDLFLSYGVMGAFMQPQGQIQVLLNILRGFGPQAALDAPRFCISPGGPDAGAGMTNAGRAGDINSEVYFEEGILPETLEQLRAMGHDARILSGFSRRVFGRGQVIQMTKDRSGKTVWAAGSDPRADGHAAAQI
ncbi:gamma-glutamyltranspeptidase [Russula earlei]|uniref:Gamma-glutamyltranspeptidase n=1 Tax=Russula earlei TaxID=71964 RepID=A0ACC0UMB0_9AGAM|nr:gamma-glutamyltranspeptidase [Russula earlei]